MKTNIITQFKTLPTAVVTNKYSPFQVAVLVVALVVIITAGLYWADPTSFDPYK